MLAGALAMGVAVAAATWKLEQAGNIADARRWAVQGPPCPAVSAAAFAAWPDKLRSEFRYDDVAFARNSGHVYCDEIHDDGGRGLGVHLVCQFTAPGVLRVTTPKGVFYFVTPFGPATVAMSRGVPTCVRGGWFKGLPDQW